MTIQHLLLYFMLFVTGLIFGTCFSEEILDLIAKDIEDDK